MLEILLSSNLVKPGIEIDPEVFEKLLASDGATGDNFGYSVAITGDGSVVIVGALYNDAKGADSGAAYIFTKQANGSYLQTQKLVASDGAAGDRFGFSIAITADGSTFIVDAHLNDGKGVDSGAAYIFTKQANGSYLETQKLLASDGATKDYFGFSLAITADGSTVVIGAFGDDDNERGVDSGSAYIFIKQANGSYLQTQKLVASDGAAGDQFGYSVAVSADGSTFIVGALRDDDKGPDSGSAYVFTKQADGSYLETQKLVAADGAAGSNFGFSVATSNTSVVIGAPNHLGKGAVYVY